MPLAKEQESFQQSPGEVVVAQVQKSLHRAHHLDVVVAEAVEQPVVVVVQEAAGIGCSNHDDLYVPWVEHNCYYYCLMMIVIGMMD